MVAPTVVPTSPISPAPPALAGVAVRGSLHMLAGQWTKYTIQFGGIVAMARLLPPAQFGLVAMITAIVGVAEVLRDFGLSSATMQAGELDRTQESALVWISIALGAVLTGVVAALAPAIADFYGRPDISVLVLALSPVFLINGFSAQLGAQLARSMRFGRVATIDAASMAIGVAVGVAAALVRRDAWALVYMQLAMVGSRTVLVMAIARFRPGRCRGARIGDLLRFGRNVTVVQLLDYASRNIDTILVGRYWGPFSVGIYARAYQLLMLPLQQINGPLTRVALPVLSRVRADRARYDRYIEFAITVMAGASTLLFAYLAVCAPDLVSVALGARWVAVAPVFQAMCVAGVLQATGYVNYWQFMSLNRTGAHVRYALVAKPLVIVAFFVAAPHGIIAVAWAYTGITALITPFGFIVAGSGSTRPWTSYLRSGTRFVPLAVVASGATAAVAGALSTLDVYPRLLLTSLTYLVVVSLGLRVVPSYRAVAGAVLSRVRPARTSIPVAAVEAG